MKNISCLFLLIIVITSCTEREEKPKDLLSKEQMRDILIETNLSANLPYNTLDSSVINIRHKADKRFLKTIALRNISLKRFKKSHQYYTRNLQEYKTIFKMVRDSLSIKLKSLKREESIAEDRNKTKNPLRNKPFIDEQKNEMLLAPIYKKLDSIKRIREK